MNTKIQVIKGSIIFIITLLLLYFTQMILFNYRINKPLIKNISSIQGIDSANVKGSYKLKEPVKIDLYFKKVSDFHKTYTEAEEKIIDILDHKPYDIALHDKSNEELENIYYDMHFQIEKALFDGNYPMLMEESEKIAQAANAEVKIFINSKFIFIQVDKDDSFLYKLIPKQE